jgi:hypothetical protein
MTERNSLLSAMDKKVQVNMCKNSYSEYISGIFACFLNRNTSKKHVISGFRRDVNEIFALLGFYAA